jgi:hypothetical protein
MRRIVRDEIAVAREAFELARADSRLGFEAATQYFYLPADLAEKVIHCRYVRLLVLFFLGFLPGALRRGSVPWMAAAAWGTSRAAYPLVEAFRRRSRTGAAVLPRRSSVPTA